MKRLLLALALLVPLIAYGVGAPVFIGTTGNYFTNTGTQILLVAANGNAIVIGQSDKSVSIIGQLNVATGSFVRVTIAADGLRVNSPSVNLTNLPGAGEFVAIDSFGGLFRTNTPAGTNTVNNYFQTNTFNNTTVFKGQTTFTSVSNYFNQIISTNGVLTPISVATRFGGALTNISLDALGSPVVHVDGSTNVNVVAMMNWAAGLQTPVTVVITNRTATVRTVSLGTTTNNWLGMGTITAPWQNTNALWIAFENLGTSNVVYAAQYIANPTN